MGGEEGMGGRAEGGGGKLRRELRLRGWETPKGRKDPEKTRDGEDKKEHKGLINKYYKERG